LTAKATDNSNATVTSIPATVTIKTDSPSQLAGWWKGEFNANDAIFKNDGTPIGGASFGSGKVGQSFNLNGSSGYINVPSAAALKVTGPFTIEAWINYSQLTGPSGDCIVAKGVDAETSIDWALTVSTNHKLRPHVKAGGTWIHFDCDTTLAAGTWYHVAMVYDGSTLKGYVNGNLDGFRPASGAVQATDNSMKIGAYAPVNGTSSKAFFAGQIDELSIYDRALSLNEIKNISDAGGAGKCAPTSPVVPLSVVSWWSAQNTPDDVVSGNDATLHNGAGYGGGMVGQGFQFDGINDYAEVLYPSLYFRPNFTVETWLKPLSQVNDPINQESIFVQSYGELQLCVRRGTTGLRVAFLFMYSPNNYVQVVSAHEIPIGQFNHLAGTWDGSTLRLYINGKLDASTPSPTHAPLPSTCNFYIGGISHSQGDSCDYVGQFFNGIVDELTFYGEALTDSDIQTIYYDGSAGKTRF